jgi:hypothetical protein
MWLITSNPVVLGNDSMNHQQRPDKLGLGMGLPWAGGLGSVLLTPGCQPSVFGGGAGSGSSAGCVSVDLCPLGRMCVVGARAQVKFSKGF